MALQDHLAQLHAIIVPAEKSLQGAVLLRIRLAEGHEALELAGQDGLVVAFGLAGQLHGAPRKGGIFR